MDDDAVREAAGSPEREGRNTSSLHKVKLLHLLRCFVLAEVAPLVEMLRPWFKTTVDLDLFQVSYWLLVIDQYSVNFNAILFMRSLCR
ncbi:uncharacterized protein LOC120650572 [Panicum virgatum]|uniref:uncharacterized protein LOC120650572 n=1 Tax=Panicum virgatum TaxID=38727 RepID=UPI0019D68766|nr:uncharacterized protein LOC120650572 [Panicum virgatum]